MHFHKALMLLKLFWRYPLASKLPEWGGYGFYPTVILMAALIVYFVHVPLFFCIPFFLVGMLALTVQAREGAAHFVAYFQNGPLPLPLWINRFFALLFFPAFWFFPLTWSVMSSCLDAARRSRDKTAAPSLAVQIFRLARPAVGLSCVIAIVFPVYLKCMSTPFFLSPAVLLLFLSDFMRRDLEAVLVNQLGLVAFLSSLLVGGAFRDISNLLFGGYGSWLTKTREALTRMRAVLRSTSLSALWAAGAQSMSNLGRKTRLSLLEEGSLTGVLSKVEAQEMDRCVALSTNKSRVPRL